MQSKVKIFIKKNYLASAMFLVSIAFFMRVMMDLTWFEYELKGNWFISRIIFSSLLSVGYLFQFDKIKNMIPRISKFTLITTIVFSILLPIIGSTQTKVIFSMLIFLIFFKIKLRSNE